MLKINVDAPDPVAAGFAPTASAFVANSPAFGVNEGAEGVSVVASYPDSGILQSGRAGPHR